MPPQSVGPLPFVSCPNELRRQRMPVKAKVNVTAKHVTAEPTVPVMLRGACFRPPEGLRTTSSCPLGTLAQARRVRALPGIA